MPKRANIPPYSEQILIPQGIAEPKSTTKAHKLHASRNELNTVAGQARGILAVKADSAEGRARQEARVRISHSLYTHHAVIKHNQLWRCMRKFLVIRILLGRVGENDQA